jgi:hypothetical protein
MEFYINASLANFQTLLLSFIFDGPSVNLPDPKKFQP